MSKTALFVRHRSKPGKRDRVKQVWQQYVQPRAAENPAHEAYFFCYDDNDPDVICVFQLLSSSEAVRDFMAGAWYPEYLERVSDHVLEPPQINTATPMWIKNT